QDPAALAQPVGKFEHRSIGPGQLRRIILAIADDNELEIPARSLQALVIVLKGLLDPPFLVIRGDDDADQNDASKKYSLLKTSILKLSALFFRVAFKKATV